MAGIFFWLVDSGLAIDLLNWRIIAGVMILGAMQGIVGLYLSGLLFRSTGKLLAGRAPAIELRAAVAWSAVPTVVGSAIYLVVLLISHLSLRGASPKQIYVVLTGALCIAVALALWSWVALLVMLARVQRFGLLRAITNVVLGYFFLFVGILIIGLPFRTFLFHPFNMPSRSMEPTLLLGDYFLVSKFAYGYTHYSLPYSPPLFWGRILAREPQRGDLVVFRLPGDDSIDYVKRLVGLPGDRIQMRDGRLYINDTPVKQERTEDFIETDETGKKLRVKTWRETLPNGVTYSILDRVPNGVYDNTPVHTVPPGHFFVLGDNRDNSTDSRVLSQVGYIPFENLVGRAEIIYWSVERLPQARQATVRFERFGLAVR